MRYVSNTVAVHDPGEASISRSVGVLTRFPKGMSRERTVSSEVDTYTREQLVDVLVSVTHLQERDHHLLEQANMDEVPHEAHDEATLALTRGVIQLQVEDLWQAFFGVIVDQRLVEDFEGRVGAKLHIIQGRHDKGLETVTKTPEDVEGNLPSCVTLVRLLVEVRQGVVTIVGTVDDLAAKLTRVMSRAFLALIVGLALVSNFIEVGFLSALSFHVGADRGFQTVDDGTPHTDYTWRSVGTSGA